MALLFCLFFTQSFSGSNMISYYMVTILKVKYLGAYLLIIHILKMSRIPLNENLAAIIVAGMYVVGYAVSSILVRRIPRRPLLLFSLFLMMLANLVVGVTLYHNNIPTKSSVFNESESQATIEENHLVGVTGLDHVLSLVPVLFSILITFGYSCGLGPVPFILLGELFPSKVAYSNIIFTLIHPVNKGLQERVQLQLQHS